MAAYLQDDWQAQQLVRLRLGSRSSHSTAAQRPAHEPRSSLSYNLQPGRRLKKAD